MPPLHKSHTGGIKSYTWFQVAQQCLAFGMWKSIMLASEESSLFHSFFLAGAKRMSLESKNIRDLGRQNA
jgi:hypothetical protein